VATADIAAKAACWLFDRGWSGHHRVGVHGAKDLSSDEAAAIISSALGEPVKCVEATLDQARGAMKGMGMPDFVVEILIEQYVAFREGRLDSAEPRTPDTTTPTTPSMALYRHSLEWHPWGNLDTADGARRNPDSRFLVNARRARKHYDDSTASFRIERTPSGICPISPPPLRD
jgi:hypothetical protein